MRRCRCLSVCLDACNQIAIHCFACFPSPRPILRRLLQLNLLFPVANIVDMQTLSLPIWSPCGVVAMARRDCHLFCTSNGLGLGLQLGKPTLAGVPCDFIGPAAASSQSLFVWDFRHAETWNGSSATAGHLTHAPCSPSLVPCGFCRSLFADGWLLDLWLWI